MIPDSSPIPRRSRSRQTLAEYIDGQVNHAPKTRAKSRGLEDKLHLSIAHLLRAIIGPEGRASDHGVLWFSYEQRAKRSSWEGAKNKSRGCIPGVCDILLVWNGRLYGIEIKTADGVLSMAQAELHHQLGRAGVYVGVCRSVDSVREQLAAWRVPTRETRL